MTRQDDCEAGPLSQFAIDNHISLHLFHGVPDNGKAEPRTGHLSRAGLVHPIEALKNSVHILLGNADPTVGDGNLHLVRGIVLDGAHAYLA